MSFMFPAGVAMVWLPLQTSPGLQTVAQVAVARRDVSLLLGRLCPALLLTHLVSTALCGFGNPRSVSWLPAHVLTPFFVGLLPAGGDFALLCRKSYTQN